MKFIRHITLTTGHVRNSYYGEAGDDIVAACRDLITRATADEGATPARIPGVGAYSLTGQASARCLTLSVWADGPPAEVICTIGVALHSLCGATLWRRLHQWSEAPVLTDRTKCPPEPWVSAALQAGIERHPGALAWLGDMERCLAWAWLEMRDKTRDQE